MLSKQATDNADISSSLLRLGAGVPGAFSGAMYGYLSAPKNNRLESISRNAFTGYLAGSLGGAGAELGHRYSGEPLVGAIAGGLVGGAAGFGVGKLIQGEAPSKQRHEFREHILQLIREENEKIKHELKRPEALQKIGEDEAVSPVTSFANKYPETALIPAAGIAGGIVESGKEKSRTSDVIKAMLSASGGTAAGIGGYHLGKGLGEGGGIAGAAGGGLLGYLLLRNALRSNEKQSASSVLTGLLQAKQHSDIREYKSKHQKLRELIEQHPEQFHIDSTDGNIVGLTAMPFNFRIHAPLRALPASFRAKALQDFKNKDIAEALSE